MPPPHGRLKQVKCSLAAQDWPGQVSFEILLTVDNMYTDVNTLEIRYICLDQLP